jgi:hypothetical protein
MFFGSEKSLFVCVPVTSCCLSTLATDATGQLDVLRHDGDALGVDGAQVRVLEQSDQVGLARLLQGHHGRALEAQVGLEVLRYLADEALEGQLADEQLGALLVTTDLAKGHRAGPVAMRLLDASRRRGALAGGLRRQLLPRGLASGRLASGLLRSCHSILLLLTTMIDDQLRMCNATKNIFLPYIPSTRLAVIGRFRSVYCARCDER